MNAVARAAQGKTRAGAIACNRAPLRAATSSARMTSSPVTAKLGCACGGGCTACMAPAIGQRSSEPVVQLKAGAARQARIRRRIERTITQFTTEITAALSAPGTQIETEQFNREMDDALALVLRHERQINRHLDGDSELTKRLRNAYRDAVDTLIRGHSQESGYTEDELWAENSGRVPMWAWPTPHHVASGYATPIADDQTLQSDPKDSSKKAYSGKIGDVEVVIRPDMRKDTLGSHAHTLQNINVHVERKRAGRGAGQGYMVGDITFTLDIQTTYKKKNFLERKVRPAGDSGYGRGSTDQDRAGRFNLRRSATLAHHEGEHGLAAQRFVTENPPKGWIIVQNPGSHASPLTAAQFEAEELDIRTQFCDYQREMLDYSVQQVDCAGPSPRKKPYKFPASGPCPAFDLSC